MADYGTGIYGVGLYGNQNPVTPTRRVGQCVDYTKFQISGVNLGLYVFGTNPTNYSPNPPRSTQQYNTIMDAAPISDIDYSKHEITMSWNLMTWDMWEDLESYYRKNIDGRSEKMYFWDGKIGEYTQQQIQVVSFDGNVVGGVEPIDRMDVNMVIRKVF